MKEGAEGAEHAGDKDERADGEKRVREGDAHGVVEDGTAENGADGEDSADDEAAGGCAAGGAEHVDDEVDGGEEAGGEAADGEVKVGGEEVGGVVDDVAAICKETSNKDEAGNEEGG